MNVPRVKQCFLVKDEVLNKISVETLELSEINFVMIEKVWLSGLLIVGMYISNRNK